MTVIIQGVKEFQAALSAMFARQDAATRIAIGRAGALLEREIKVAISLTGEPSSPPGEPPFLRTGDLRRSIQTDPPTSLGQGRWSTQVGPTIAYGRIQELGGRTGRGHATVLPPRPYVAPTLEKFLPTMRQVHRDAWNAAMRG